MNQAAILWNSDEAKRRRDAIHDVITLQQAMSSKSEFDFIDLFVLQFSAFGCTK